MIKSNSLSYIKVSSSSKGLSYFLDVFHFYIEA